MPSMEEILKSVREALAGTDAIQQRHTRMIADHQELFDGQNLAIARHERWLAEQEHAVARQNAWVAEHQAAMRRLEELMEQFVKSTRANGRKMGEKPASAGDERLQKKILHEQLKLREDIIRIYKRLEIIELDVTKLKARHRKGSIALEVVRKKQS